MKKELNKEFKIKKSKKFLNNVFKSIKGNTIKENQSVNY